MIRVEISKSNEGTPPVDVRDVRRFESYRIYLTIVGICDNIIKTDILKFSLKGRFTR